MHTHVYVCISVYKASQEVFFNDPYCEWILIASPLPLHVYYSQRGSEWT
uniref:Uncharacterized protein n=1 Tax=Anguilla anguilla TaxID=7936 RepID=A0A0E9Q078_ANGAN